MNNKKKWNILSDKTLPQSNESTLDYILRLRGIKSRDKFLSPNIDDMIPLNQFKNLNKAIALLYYAIRDNWNVCVYYDVDVDGITAGTIMYRYLKMHGIKNVTWKINKGKQHGVSFADPEEFKDVDLLIVVDSIDLDYTVYDKFNCRVLILDHHDFHEYPENAVLVSSAKNYANPQLSGAGVAYKVCKFVDSVYKKHYADSLVDLACCGILGDVCDMSENSMENRYIVKEGLNNLNNLALRTIKGAYDFNSQTVLWSIAPLVNAANRTDNNELAVHLFLSDDLKEIRSLIKQIKECKVQQDETVLIEYVNILDQLKLTTTPETKVLFGVTDKKNYSGLIATKISNYFNMPCVIFYNNDDTDELGGSMRSEITNFKTIINESGLAQAYGHETAAGIVCKKSNINLLFNYLNTFLSETVFETKLDVDLNLDHERIDFNIVRDIEKINTMCGHNFDPVTACVTNVRVFGLSKMKEKHTKFTCNGITFIKWNDTKLYDELSAHLFDHDYFATIDLVGELQTSNFRGINSINMIISDYQNIVFIPEFLND